MHFNKCKYLEQNLLRKEPEGGYPVIDPSLPCYITYGNTIDDAVKMAKEAIELYIESLKTHGEEIPTEEDTLECTLTIKSHT
ncbi:MAG: type II toxin-antitoxin system HicB family antitoxin [Planctomycetes bacterium]|nr:type II toxin-antitoxin system HicB family antitoxin [Planctomycetota bacterium]